MNVVKVIDGRRVKFITQIRDGRDWSGLGPKIIDVFVDGGGCGPYMNWVEAMRAARRMTYYANTAELARKAKTEVERARIMAPAIAHFERYLDEINARSSK